MEDYQREIEQIEHLFSEGDLDELRKLLPPLVEKNIPAAIRISSSFFEQNIPEEEMDRIYVEGMFKAAELGDLKAKYQVGVFYDLGEYDIQEDKVKASYIFKELSDEGDAHCMWIYACELIWGRGSFPKSTEEGLTLLYKASELGSANACMTIADFFSDGKFGHQIDLTKRDMFRVKAQEYDDTTYDPYAIQSKPKS